MNKRERELTETLHSQLGLIGELEILLVEEVFGAWNSTINHHVPIEVGRRFTYLEEALVRAEETVKQLQGRKYK